MSRSPLVELSSQSSSYGDMLIDCHLTPPCKIAVSPALRGPANFFLISSLSCLYSVSPNKASVTHAPPGRAMLDIRPRFHFFPAFWISTSIAATSIGDIPYTSSLPANNLLCITNGSPYLRGGEKLPNS